MAWEAASSWRASACAFNGQALLLGSSPAALAALIRMAGRGLLYSPKSDLLRTRNSRKRGTLCKVPSSNSSVRSQFDLHNRLPRLGEFAGVFVAEESAELPAGALVAADLLFDPETATTPDLRPAQVNACARFSYKGVFSWTNCTTMI